MCAIVNTAIANGTKVTNATSLVMSMPEKNGNAINVSTRPTRVLT